MIKPHPQPQTHCLNKKNVVTLGGVLELGQQLLCSYAHMSLIYDSHASSRKETGGTA